jgi:hypothetical protein
MNMHAYAIQSSLNGALSRTLALRPGERVRWTVGSRSGTGLFICMANGRDTPSASRVNSFGFFGPTAVLLVEGDACIKGFPISLVGRGLVQLISDRVA